MELDLTNLDKFKIATINIELGIQIFLLIILFLYGLFNLLVYKQVKILNQTIHTPLANIINQAALAQLIAVWLLAAIVILLILL